MIDAQVLSEKLKYLIIMESKPKFEILKFFVDVSFVDYEKKTEIEDYSVDMKFDYTGRIDASSNDFGFDVQKMMNLMSDYVSRYIITPDGKISKSYDAAFVDEGAIWSIDYEYDQKHHFNTSFKVMYV
jgi:hypothetical protein